MGSLCTFLKKLGTLLHSLRATPVLVCGTQSLSKEQTCKRRLILCESLDLLSTLKNKHKLMKDDILELFNHIRVHIYYVLETYLLIIT